MQLFAQLRVGQPFVVHAVAIMADTELLHADLHGRVVARGDDGSLHAGLLQHFDAVAVQRVKRFHHVARRADKQLSGSQDAVHVQNQQFDFGGAFTQFGGHGNVHHKCVLMAELRYILAESGSLHVKICAIMRDFIDRSFLYG